MPADPLTQDDPCTVAHMLQLLAPGKSDLATTTRLVREAFEASGADRVRRQSIITQIAVSRIHQSPVSASMSEIQAFTLKKSAPGRVDAHLKRVKVEEGFMSCICGSKRIDWEDRHTRSADEGSTLFCKCTDCGNFWKVQS